jgi:MinD superfamily P-loop ATPase
MAATTPLSQFLRDLTWTCHVCGTERPDDAISVLSGQVTIGHRVFAQVNVRYCNDRLPCATGAFGKANEMAAVIENASRRRGHRADLVIIDETTGFDPATR